MHLFLAFMLYFFGVMFCVGLYRDSLSTDKNPSYFRSTFAIIFHISPAHVVGLIPVAALAIYLKEWWLFPAVIVLDIILSHMWWVMGSRKKGNQ
jgi:hypothetical protein